MYDYQYEIEALGYLKTLEWNQTIFAFNLFLFTNSYLNSFFFRENIIKVFCHKIKGKSNISFTTRRDNCSNFHWDTHQKVWRTCGEVISVAQHNAVCTLSQSTRSGMIISWPDTPWSGSSLYIWCQACNIFSLILVLNQSTSLHWVTSVATLSSLHRPADFRRHSDAVPSTCHTLHNFGNM